MKLIYPLTKQRREHIKEIVTLFLLRVSPAPVEKLFRLMYLLDVIHFGGSAVTATHLTYFGHSSGPIPIRLASELSSTFMGGLSQPKNSLLPQTVGIVIERGSVTLSCTHGAWTDEYEYMSPHTFGIMEQLVRQYGDAEARHIDVSAHDRGAWMKQVARQKPGVIEWPDTLDANDPRTPEMINNAQAYVMRAKHLASSA